MIIIIMNGNNYELIKSLYKDAIILFFLNINYLFLTKLNILLTGIEFICRIREKKREIRALVL